MLSRWNHFSFHLTVPSISFQVQNLKKKITLIEGQRKAIYTSLEKEKACNREREINLEEELVTLKEELVRSQATKETLLDKVPGGSNSDRLAYICNLQSTKCIKVLSRKK